MSILKRIFTKDKPDEFVLAGRGNSPEEARQIAEFNLMNWLRRHKRDGKDVEILSREERLQEFSAISYKLSITIQYSLKTKE